ncbi:MAG: DUF3500 domain-containing protein [Planctomycetota bacterium]|nr:DUF3500 domain-containing protein [Planctomycetota bacterium]
MKYRFVLTLVLAASYLTSSVSMAQEAAGETGVKIQLADQAEGEKKKGPAVRLLPTANAFLKTLNDEQKALAMLDFDSEKRIQWHFIPKETRKGFPIRDMSEEQKAAAYKLLQASVSKAGFEKSKQIMKLESVLLKLEGPKSEGKRDSEKYYFTFFGTPKAKEKWGLSIEGHHLSLNFVFEGWKIIDSTPQFMAANPATLKDDFGDGFEKGYRALKAEEQTAFNLVKSLNEKQFKAAELPGDTPSEIRAAGEAQPPTEALPGLAAGDMDEAQVAKLRNLLKAYTNKMKPLVAKERWEQIEKAGFEKVKFSWSGPKRPGVGHYYVIQGPSFLVEFINVQPDAAGNPANHIHCVWRDTSGDFDLPVK